MAAQQQPQVRSSGIWTGMLGNVFRIVSHLLHVEDWLSPGTTCMTPRLSVVLREIGGILLVQSRCNCSRLEAHELQARH